MSGSSSKTSSLRDRSRSNLLLCSQNGSDPAAAEAVELDEPAVDLAYAAKRERVDERAADPGRLALDELERPVELLVADEHVPVHLVARAAADRVVRVVAEQVAPGQPQVGNRIRRVLAQCPQRGRRLDREQPPLRALIRLLEVDPRRVDAAQDVLEPAADELALVDRQPVGQRACARRSGRSGTGRRTSPRGRRGSRGSSGSIGRWSEPFASTISSWPRLGRQPPRTARRSPRTRSSAS